MDIPKSALLAVREQFFASGQTVAEWARCRGFSEGRVYAVLNGQSKAIRGESHRVAVALGLKLEARPPGEALLANTHAASPKGAPNEHEGSV